MFGGRILGGRKPTIKIQPYQDIFHLHPPSGHERLPGPVSVGEETFWGNVALSLPSATKIDNLEVKLVGYYALALPGHSTETGALGEWGTNISVPRHLDEGEYSFAWSLKLPRSSAPYERCMFGNVNYKLVAIAEGPAGEIKTDRQLEVIAVPVLTSSEAETSPLNEHIEGRHQDTGPYLMTLESQHLTVGGPIRFTLNFPAVPSVLRLHSITATIVQSYALHSQKRPAETRSPPSHRWPLFHLDYRSPLWDESGITAPPDPASENANQRRLGTVLRTSSAVDSRSQGFMAVLADGDSLRISHVARLPDDYVLRATTLEGTRTPIRISHAIVLDIKFSTPRMGLHLLRSERSLTLLSCGCLPDDIVVPPYFDVARKAGGATAVHKKLKDGARGTSADNYYVCVCLYTFDALIQPLLGAHQAHSGLCTTAEDTFVANKLIL